MKLLQRYTATYFFSFLLLFLLLLLLQSHPSEAASDPGDTVIESPHRNDSNKTSETDFMEAVLFTHLMDGYVRNVRPVKNHRRAITVRLGLTIMKINEIVERDQELVTSCCVKMKWHDDRLSWDPAEFDDLGWFALPRANIWTPDIALVNSPDPYLVTSDQRFIAEVSSSGWVGIYPSGKLHTRCELDLTFFPFDAQECIFRFESWTYPDMYLNFTLWDNMSPANPIEFKFYVENNQWKIKGMRAEMSTVTYDGLNFSRIDFHIRLERKSLFYAVYAILPCTMLSVLQMFAHCLPVDESERIPLATTILIAFSVFHVAIVEHMPKSSDTLPLIAIYIACLMALICFSLIETFLIFNFLSMEGRPPKSLRRIMYGPVGKVVLIFKRDKRKLCLRKYGIMMAMKNVADHAPMLPYASKAKKTEPETNGGTILGRKKSCGDVQNHSHECGVQELYPLLNQISRQLSLLTEFKKNLEKKEQRQLIKDEWLCLACVVDRYVFIMFVIANILFPLFLFKIVPEANHGNTMYPPQDWHNNNGP